LRLLLSTIGRRGYMVEYFRDAGVDAVVGTGCERWTPGFASCDHVELVPPIAHPEYDERLLSICERNGIDGLLSFSDPDVHRLAYLRSELASVGTTAFVPSPRAADLSFDKLRMADTLGDLGIHVPETTTSLEAAVNWGTDVFVKPRFGSGSRHTFLAESALQMEAFASLEPDMVFQRVATGDHVNLETCGDLDGRTIGMSLWRRHRSRLGETELAETFFDPDVAAFAEKLARVLSIRGPADIDLVIGQNSISVLDINPRFGGGYPVSHLAGVDFPGKIVRMLKGEKVTPSLEWQTGVVMLKELRVIGGGVSETAKMLGLDG
jgi:carbamoyl-phosphate synthase large subunit